MLLPLRLLALLRIALLLPLLRIGLLLLLQLLLRIGLRLPLLRIALGAGLLARTQLLRLLGIPLLRGRRPIALLLLGIPLLRGMPIAELLWLSLLRKLSATVLERLQRLRHAVRQLN